MPTQDDERTNVFEVKVKSGVSVSGVIVGFTVMNVEVRPIFQDGPGVSRRSQFIGGGLSIGLKVGGCGESDWERIQTPSPMTTDTFRGTLGGIASYPSATFGKSGGSLGMTLNFGGPRGTGNLFVDPQGRSYGVTLFGAQGGWWFGRGR